MSKERGKFIVVYGMNNLGKTTQVRRLCRYLETEGLTVQCLKYPIYNLEPTGPRINHYLRSGALKHLTPLEVQTLYAQNRRDYQETLERTLAEGTWVVAEDYAGTGVAWGMIFGADKNALVDLNEGLLRPDLEILFNGERLLAGKESNHAHENMSPEDWERGRKIHLELAHEFGWRAIWANGSEDEVFSCLVGELENYLPLKEYVFYGKER